MRVGINIPNDLYKRMGPLKGKVNISQICREAIQAHVEAHVRASLTVKRSCSTEEMVDRLTNREPIVDWEGWGMEDAKAWLEAAGPEDYGDLMEMLEAYDGEGLEHLIPPYLPGIREFYELEQDNLKWIRQQRRLDRTKNPIRDARQEYMRGWIAYVKVVQDKIQQRRQEMGEARIKELLNLRPSLAGAKVPEQLL